MEGETRKRANITSNQSPATDKFLTHSDPNLDLALGKMSPISTLERNRHGVYSPLTNNRAAWMSDVAKDLAANQGGLGNARRITIWVYGFPLTWQP